MIVLIVVAAICVVCLAVIIGSFLYELWTGEFVHPRFVHIPFTIMIVAVVGFFLYEIFNGIR